MRGKSLNKVDFDESNLIFTLVVFVAGALILDKVGKTGNFANELRRGTGDNFGYVMSGGDFMYGLLDDFKRDGGFGDIYVRDINEDCGSAVMSDISNEDDDNGDVNEHGEIMDEIDENGNDDVDDFDAEENEHGDGEGADE